MDTTDTTTTIITTRIDLFGVRFPGGGAVWAEQTLLGALRLKHGTFSELPGCDLVAHLPLHGWVPVAEAWYLDGDQYAEGDDGYMTWVGRAS